jgi:hypothetical protein
MRLSADFSLPFFREILRRHRSLTIVASLVLICSGFFPIVFLKDGSRLVWEAVAGDHPVYFVLVGIVPIIGGIAAFRYLHRPGAASIIYALPVSKKGMFFSAYLAGLLLTVVPFLLNAVSYLPFVSYQFNILSFGNGDRPDVTNLLRWLFISLIAILFIYTATTLASIISGNLMVTLLMALFINCMTPLFYMLGSSYLTSFFLGFDNLRHNTVATAKLLHPLLSVLVAESTPLWIPALYGGACLLLGAAAYGLHQRRKAEVTEIPIVFPSMQIATTTLVTLLGMSFFGFLHYSLLPEADGTIYRLSHFYFGAMIGALFTFIITRMAIEKSVHILNRRMVRSLICVILTGTLFTTLMTTDVCGFVKRVPEAGKVTTADLDFGHFNLLPYSYDDVNDFERLRVTFRAQDNICSVADFHEAVVAGKIPAGSGYGFPIDRLISVKMQKGMPINRFEYGRLRIRYHMKNGKQPSRLYALLSAEAKNYAAFRNLMESEEYKDNTCIKTKIGYDNIKTIDIQFILPDEPKEGSAFILPEFSEQGSSVKIPLDPSDNMALSKHLDRDFLRLNFDEMADDATVNFCFFITYTDRVSGKKKRTRTIRYFINEHYIETQKWLRSHLIQENTEAVQAAEAAENGKEGWQVMIGGTG